VWTWLLIRLLVERENDYLLFITGRVFISSAITLLVLLRFFSVGTGWCQRRQPSRAGSMSTLQYTQSLKLNDTKQLNENSAPWHSDIKSICTVSIRLCKVQLCNTTSIQLYVHPMLKLTKKSTKVELVQLLYFTVWSVPEAATTVLCTPDNGRDGRPKHVE